MSHLVDPVVAVQVQHGDKTSDVQLVLNDAHVTVDQVLDELGLCAGSVTIDGAPIADLATQSAQAVIQRGSRLSSSEPLDPVVPIVSDGGQTNGSSVSIEVAVVAGFAAGAHKELEAGSHRFPTLPDGLGNPFAMQVEPSTAARAPWHSNGDSIQTVALPSQIVAICKALDPEAGQTTIQRPPRINNTSGAEPIVVPPALAPIAEPAPLSWATLLAPIPIALLMAFFFRPLFAIFAAMGPIVALGRWYEARRRFGRATKERTAALQILQGELAHQRRAQAERIAQLRWLANPHVAELWRRARQPSVRLWERRPHAAGYLCLTIGVGSDTAPVQLQANEPGSSKRRLDLVGELADPLPIRAVPHVVDLAAVTGLGIHGDRDECMAVARAAVLQLATLQGPADVTVSLVCHQEFVGDWDWLKWLPHLDPLLVAQSAQPLVDRFRRIEAAAGPARPAFTGTAERVEHAHIVIVDDPTADTAAICAAAKAAGEAIRIVAIAPDATRLPASCQVMVELANQGTASATVVAAGEPHHDKQVCPVGITALTAASWARSLSACVDPERGTLFSGLGQSVSLERLLGADTPEQIAQRWSNRSPVQAPCATVGVTHRGAFTIDLVADGPHALIAGTTGSGKSELLRTLVVSLAHECPPEQLNFVLVDFKGGGAFDSCADLPHVAGLITDLDETLVGRAIESLQAELHRREVLFRNAGASAYEQAVVLLDEPLARLVVVIDEFAALASDYGDLLSSIVDLAARGRSLGMHLVLATQRPSGVIDQKIRANTNLRIALRVQDLIDSQDVVGSTDAASIDRAAPGRAVFRTSGDTAHQVQTAYCGDVRQASRPCVVQPWDLFPVPIDQAGACAPNGEGETELAALVAAITSANRDRSARARPLWSEPLPETLDWIDLGSRALAYSDDSLPHTAGVSSTGLALGLVDLPSAQTQLPWCWDPKSGALAIVGASAVCTAKVVVSAVAALVSQSGPDRTHVYVMDGGLVYEQALQDLPHVGAVVLSHEQERIERLLSHIESEVARRRTNRSQQSSPMVVLLIENLAAVLGGYSDMDVLSAVDQLSSIARDGAPYGVHLVVTARTARDIGHRLGQQIPHRLVLELADSSGYLTLGLASNAVVALPKMRAIDVASSYVVQLVEPPDITSRIDAATAGEEPTGVGLPRPIEKTPALMPVDELAPALVEEDGALVVPVGVAVADLSPVAMRLAPGEHVLVLTSSGMGRTSTMGMLARQIASAHVGTIWVGSAGPTSDVAGSGALIVGSLDQLENALKRLDAAPAVVLVDDGHRIGDELAGALAKLLDSADPLLRMIVGATAEHARSVRSWTHAVRSSGTAILLGTAQQDADLFKVRSNRSDTSTVVPGRGLLIGRGTAQAVQVACGPL